MASAFIKISFGFLTAATAAISAAQVVVPNGLANTAGNSQFFLTATTTPGRKFQFQIHESQLAGLVGMNLNGLQFRLNENATAAWPSNAVNFSRFDVFIGPGVNPANRSATFANNFTSTPVQVRSGALSFNVGAFSATGSPVKPFGPAINFSDYRYTGGHLAIELRYSNQTGATTGLTVDAVSTGTTGFGTQFASSWQSDPNATIATTTTSSVPVIRLSASSPVPEPATVAALGLGLTALLRRRRK